MFADLIAKLFTFGYRLPGAFLPKIITPTCCSYAIQTDGLTLKKNAVSYLQEEGRGVVKTNMICLVGEGCMMSEGQIMVREDRLVDRKDGKKPYGKWKSAWRWETAKCKI